MVVMKIMVTLMNEDNGDHGCGGDDDDGGSW